MDDCPNCGADLPPRARSCPECGSDEKTGWSDQAHSSRLGLPDEEFNYAEFVRDEFGPEQQPPRSRRWIWSLIALLLVAFFLFRLFR